jgi:hypothetical protein
VSFDEWAKQHPRALVVFRRAATHRR